MPRTFQAFVILVASCLSLHAQVQLFEQGHSGINPSASFLWNPSQMNYSVGFDYNIEGKTVLGMNFTKPLTENINHPNISSFSLNPFGEFEFVEPSIQRSFSFAVQAGYDWTTVTKEELSLEELVPDENVRNNLSADLKDTILDLFGDNLNDFGLNRIYGGPVFAYRVYVSDVFKIIPSASYEFGYVRLEQDSIGVRIPGPPYQTYEIINNSFRDTYLTHDFQGSITFHYEVNDFHGIVFRPILRVGIGEFRDELITVKATLGYTLRL